jgi:hypothetical protein
MEFDFLNDLYIKGDLKATNVAETFQGNGYFSALFYEAAKSS